MSETVVLDSWAWWEILHDTPTGRQLSLRYVEGSGVKVLTVDLALAEVACKLERAGSHAAIAPCLRAIEEAGEVLPITREIAGASAPLLVALRRVDAHTSLADAVMLAAARVRGAVLVSDDPCYRGEDDVRSR